MLRKIFAASLLISVCFCLFACKKAHEVVSIDTESGFRSLYYLDDEMTLGNIIVKYSDGKSEKMPCTADMVTDFDASTTGDKVMTISYGGKSIEFEYKVEYLRSIETSNRLVLKAERKSGNTNLTIEGKFGISDGVKAVKFTIFFPDTNHLTAAALIISNRPGVKCDYSEIDKMATNALNLVVTSEKSKALPNGVFLKITVGGNVGAGIKLTNAAYSDGKRDYDLPDAEEQP